MLTQGLIHVDWPRTPNTCGTRVTSVMLEPHWEVKEGFVYIGMPGFAGQTSGYFGKPWACKHDHRGWRYTYREYLRNRLRSDPIFRASVKALHGKTLVCFCKGGKRGPDADCHGDLLVQAIEYLNHR